MTYFDAVLDGNLRPLFNDIPKNVRVWLRDQDEIPDTWRVCPGRTMALVTVVDYMNGKTR
jgi:hypothetical protein